MYCTKCGKEISDQTNVCGYCGTPAVNNIVNPSNYIQEDTEPLSMGSFLVMLLIMCVPIANIIMLCVWAFSSGTNVNRRNFARAYLIITLVVFVLYIILGATMINLFVSLSQL
ncbi:MAG: zinc ribbon domain-containing protein [Clostridia bacterium]|nr:zinc ribbon domain-containing protein [Clostridia bacterium]